MLPAPATPGLSLDAAAELLGVGRSTVRRLVAAGEVPAWRVGARVVVDADGLLAYRDRNRIAPAAPPAPRPPADDWRKRWAATRDAARRPG